jgi:hypothetical protein
LPTEKALERNVNRFNEKRRLIDPELTVSVGDKPTRTYFKLKQEGAFDTYERYSTDGERGRPAVKILEGERAGGEILRHGGGGERYHSGILSPAESGAGSETQTGATDGLVEYLTNPDFRENTEFIEKTKSGVARRYQNLVSGQAPLERLGKIQVKTGLENGKASVTDIVQMVRNAPQTAEYILYKGLVDKNGDVVTIKDENGNDVSLSYKDLVAKWPKGKEQAYFDYTAATMACCAGKDRPPRDRARLTRVFDMPPSYRG